jgi:hypothetical protein
VKIIATLCNEFTSRSTTEGAGGSGHTGGKRYYTEAAGEPSAGGPPCRWAAGALMCSRLAGEMDADVMQRLYVDDTDRRVAGGQAQGLTPACSPGNASAPLTHDRKEGQPAPLRHRLCSLK